MADLVTLAQAKTHLRIDGTSEDTDIAMKITQASAIVLDYIARDDADWQAEIAAWTDVTVPAVVQAAVLLQLANLYGSRGDDLEQPEGMERGFLAPGVANLLMRYRDPVVA